MMRPVIVLLLAAFISRHLAAQAVPEPTFSAWSAGHPSLSERTDLRLAGAALFEPPPVDAVTLGLAGIAGSAAGVLAGGYVGYHLDRADGECSEWCGLEGMFFGAAIGSAVLAPVAVHMANGGRGDLETTLFTSGVITGAGAVLALVTNSAEVLVAVPLAAIIGSVALERSTTPASE